MTSAVASLPVSRFSVLAGLSGPVLATFEDTDQRIESGTVTANRLLTVRRSASLRISDPTGELAPRDPGDLLYQGAWLRVERGDRGTGAWRTLATCVVDGFTTDMTGHLSVTGKDPLALLLQPFGTPVVIADGTPAEVALRMLWEPVLGDGSDWPLDAEGRTLPQRVFLPDRSRLDEVVEYLKASGLEVFADRLGRPLLRAAPDATSASTPVPIRDFRPGADASILTLARRSSRAVYNRVVVASNAPGVSFDPVVLTVDDTASPLHPDRIGLRTAPVYRSAEVPDIGAAVRLARQLLTEYGYVLDTVDGTAVPDFDLDAGDIVELTEPFSGTVGRYRLDSITLPVTQGSMSISAGRVVPLVLTADVA